MEIASIAEAKAHLSQLIHKTENGEVVHLSRHGRQVAVLLSEEQYQQITNKRTTPWDAISKWRDNTVIDENDLDDKEIDEWRDRSEIRDFSWEE